MIKIICDSESYSVLYTSPKDDTYELGYGDKDTSMEDHAQNLYELCAAMNIVVEMTKA